MALTPSWPGVTALATTTDARKNLAGLIVKDTAGVARAGIFPAHLNPLVSARIDMNVDIAAFVGAAVQFGGPVLIANDGVAQLPSPLISPGAGTNYYVIYAKQNESTSPGTDANTNRVFGAQLSTTSFAVARAALPAGALELGTVEMPTGKTATNQAGVIITATHRFTATAGGVVWVRNSTELAAWTPADGNLALNLADTITYKRVGGAWKPWDSPAIAYTPAGFGVTVGSGGSSTFLYWFTNGLLNVEFDIVFGTGAAIPGTGVTFNLPVGFAFNAFYRSYHHCGVGIANNDGAGGVASMVAVARYGLNHALLVLGQNTGGAYEVGNNASLTVPVTMAPGGFFSGRAELRVA